MNVSSPSELYRTPRLRQAARTLAATRGSALWKRQGDSNSKVVVNFHKYINLEVARHGLGIKNDKVQ